ncbi:PD40 domain-containing protein [Methanococcoides sp. NM1]|uniref:TolB family protein n=1 Tax=Methanococcoides sp. NM1 TaxID=1201013 RepID=UPI001082F80D|nr:PD40 domain-containing protein [Methanococcoides sp. NM1]
MTLGRNNTGTLVLKIALIASILLISTALAGAITIEETEQLTFDVNQRTPAWSPDGKLITYSSEQAIWVMNTDGSDQTRVYDTIAWEGEPSFSSDGKFIYYATEHVQPFSSKFISIRVVELADKSNTSQITENADKRAPVMSPDGTKIAYLSKVSGNYDIWVMNPDGGKNQQITDSANDEGAPSWSPEGEMLAYSLEGNLWTVNLTNRVPVVLRNDTFENTHPVFNPDGTKIAFVSDRSGNSDIWVMNSNSLGIEQITFENSTQTYPAWSPDGDKIAFASNEGGDYNIWTLTLSDTDRPIELGQDKELVMEEEEFNILKELEDFAKESPLRTLTILFAMSIFVILFFLRNFLKGL